MPTLTPADLKSLNLRAAIIHFILEGFANDEIAAALALPKAQRSYPCWYRCEMMR